MRQILFIDLSDQSTDLPIQVKEVVTEFTFAALALEREMLRESFQGGVFVVVAEGILVLFVVSIFFSSWQLRKRLSGTPTQMKEGSPKCRAAA